MYMQLLCWFQKCVYNIIEWSNMDKIIVITFKISIIIRILFIIVVILLLSICENWLIISCCWIVITIIGTSVYVIDDVFVTWIVIATVIVSDTVIIIIIAIVIVGAMVNYTLLIRVELHYHYVKKQKFIVAMLWCIDLSLMDLQVNINSVNELYSKLQLIVVFDVSKWIN